MEKRYNINDFERKDTFFLYHNRNNPFIFLTVKLDITNIFKYCKKNKNTYATMGYLICKVDGQHIGDFVNKLEININKFNKERKE